MGLYVLVEYPRPCHVGNRRVVQEVGVLELQPTEAAELNRRLVHTPCRVLPASKEFLSVLGLSPTA